VILLFNYGVNKRGILLVRLREPNRCHVRTLSHDMISLATDLIMLD